MSSKWLQFLDTLKYEFGVGEDMQHYLEYAKYKIEIKKLDIWRLHFISATYWQLKSASTKNWYLGTLVIFRAALNEKLIFYAKWEIAIKCEN
jgi:hypothetical protein